MLVLYGVFLCCVCMAIMICLSVNVYNVWYVQQTYVLNCAQSAARTCTYKHKTYAQHSISMQVFGAHLGCVTGCTAAANRSFNFGPYQIVLLWNEPMFLWQDKLSCNGSFKLVCQVHGSGSIILIRHLHLHCCVKSKLSKLIAVCTGLVHQHLQTHGVSPSHWRSLGSTV